MDTGTQNDPYKGFHAIWYALPCKRRQCGLLWQDQKQCIEGWFAVASECLTPAIARIPGVDWVGTELKCCCGGILGQELGQQAMHDNVGVAPDWGCEVCVHGCCQGVVPPVLHLGIAPSAEVLGLLHARGFLKRI